MLQKPYSNCITQLYQPFTDPAILARPSIRDDMLHGEDLGKAYVMSYAIPRFCKGYSISSERLPMKRKRLAIFSQIKKSKKKKEDNLKEQCDVLEVLAASAVKSDTSRDLVGFQLTRFPQLFCDSNGKTFRRKTKTGCLKFLEKKYPNAFNSKEQKFSSDGLIVRDAMQDLYLQPKSMQATYMDYFKLFWRVKVKPNFFICNNVCLAFDMQHRSSISLKDALRADISIAKERSLKK